jgi:hypothetical protein
VGNVKYTSPRIQNEIIPMCEKLIKNDIVNLANAANAFSVIADEIADTFGTEQLSIGIRFLDKHSNPPKIREEFSRFYSVRQIKCSIRSYKHYIIYD